MTELIEGFTIVSHLYGLIHGVFDNLSINY